MTTICTWTCSGTGAAAVIAGSGRVRQPVAILPGRAHMSAMEQEIIAPQPDPKGGSQAFGNLGCILAATGATAMTFSLLGSAAAASVWAIVKLLGLPDTVLYGAMVVSLLPVLWATVWTAGRAWHVERLLARGSDADTPVFRLAHYLKGTR